MTLVLDSVCTIPLFCIAPPVLLHKVNSLLVAYFAGGSARTGPYATAPGEGAYLMLWYAVLSGIKSPEASNLMVPPTPAAAAHSSSSSTQQVVSCLPRQHAAAAFAADC
jgi:hypothetical protein